MLGRFTKADLKDGMVVEARKSSKYIVLKDLIIGVNGAMKLEGYNDNLLLNEDIRDGIEDQYDIMAAYEFCSHGKYPNILDLLNENKYLKLIWERKETKRMTTEEMRAKLEELTGDMIAIEPSREEMIGKLRLYCDGKSDCSKCVLSDMSPRCDYWKVDSEKLRLYYEKVMENGREES